MILVSTWPSEFYVASIKILISRNHTSTQSHKHVTFLTKWAKIGSIKARDMTLVTKSMHTVTMLVTFLSILFSTYLNGSLTFQYTCVNNFSTDKLVSVILVYNSF